MGKLHLVAIPLYTRRLHNRHGSKATFEAQGFVSSRLAIHEASIKCGRLLATERKYLMAPTADESTTRKDMSLNIMQYRQYVINHESEGRKLPLARCKCFGTIISLGAISERTY